MCVLSRLITITGVCLRRAGNSVAAAGGILNSLRQVQGRWCGPETMDQSYMFVHRDEFRAIGPALMNSDMGGASAWRGEGAAQGEPEPFDVLDI